MSSNTGRNFWVIFDPGLPHKNPTKIPCQIKKCLYNDELICKACYKNF